MRASGMIVTSNGTYYYDVIRKENCTHASHITITKYGMVMCERTSKGWRTKPLDNTSSSVYKMLVRKYNH